MQHAFSLSRVSVVCAALLLTSITGASGQSSTPQPVSIRFVKSSAADYVMYLLFRSTESYSDLEKAVPLPDVPVMEERISLPEVAASSDITDYAQLFPLIEPYKHPSGRVVLMPGRERKYRILAYDEPLPTFERLQSSLQKGAVAYPTFVRYWTEHISPDESAKIIVWQAQADKWNPFEGLLLQRNHTHAGATRVFRALCSSSI